MITNKADEECKYSFKIEDKNMCIEDIMLTFNLSYKWKMKMNIDIQSEISSLSNNKLFNISIILIYLGANSELIDYVCKHISTKLNTSATAAMSLFI